MAQPRKTARPAPPRRRYPVGALRPAAIARGREIVAMHGAQALSLRGLARDLGVSAPALLYYFGTRDGMRAAVAESIQEELEDLTKPPPRVGRAQQETLAAGERWIAFAEENPNLYRLAFGDGWRGPGLGWKTAWMSLPLPTDRLEYKLRRALDRDRRAEHLPAETPAALSRHVAAGIHGLATARLDGAAADIVKSSLAMLVAAIPPARWPSLQA